MEQHNVVIIGSGPAGYTAAIYAARADLKPIMYVGLQPGGQLTTTTEVDNFPGYPQGVDGNAMMEDLKNQAERFGTDVRWGMISSVVFSDTPGGFHTLTVDEGMQIQAQSVIIATGATAKYLGLPSEEKFMGHGVSACAVCDGFFYKGQNVVIVVVATQPPKRHPTLPNSAQRSRCWSAMASFARPRRCKTAS